MNELFLEIETAESAFEDRDDYYETICELSKHEAATRILLDSLIFSVIAEEKQWQKIEQRADYQAKYTTREQARKDFLHLYFARN